MDYDDDDLPDGYPNVWERLTGWLREYRRLPQGKNKLKQRAAEQRHYDRMKNDPEWMAKRRAASREQYAKTHPNVKPHKFGRKKT